MTYSLTGDETARDFFFMNSASGVLTTKLFLTATDVKEFRVRAVDITAIGSCIGRPRVYILQLRCWL